MNITVHLATYLRNLAGADGAVRITGDAGTVGAALRLLYAQCPAMRERIVDENGALREHVGLYINQDNIKHLGGLSAPLRDGDELWILPAVSGG